MVFQESETVELKAIVVEDIKKATVQRLMRELENNKNIYDILIEIVM